MNRHSCHFKKTAAQVATKSGFNMGAFIGDYGLNDFLIDEIKDEDGPGDIGAKALHFFCLDEAGKFNGFEVGVKTAIQFLRETLGGPPPGDQSVQCFRDLKQILTSKPAQKAIREWVESYFDL